MKKKSANWTLPAFQDYVVYYKFSGGIEKSDRTAVS